MSERAKALEASTVNRATLCGLVAQRESEKAALQQEIEKLKARLHEVREIYAGMDGFEPETAPEGYCLRIIEQMHKASLGRGEDEA